MMTIDLDRYQELKEKADKARADADRAAGALDRTMEELEEKYGCKTLSDAKKMLKKLEREERNAADEYETALEKFEDEWAGRFGDL